MAIVMDAKSKAEYYTEPTTFLIKNVYSKFVKKFDDPYNVRFRFCITFLVSFQCANILGVITEKNIKQKVETAKFTLALLAILYQYITYYRKRDHLLRYRRLSEETFLYILSKEKFFDSSLDVEYSLFQKNRTKQKTRFRYWITLIGGTYSLTMITPFFAGKDENDRCFLKLPLVIWMPFECDSPGVYSLLYAYSFITISIFALTMTFTAMLRSCLSSTVTIQCQALKKFIENIGRQILMIDDIYTDYLVVIFICYALVICLTAFQTVIVLDKSEVPMVIGFFLVIAMSFYSECNMGSTLHECMTSVADSAYCSDWYDFQPKDRRMILFCVFKAQESRHIKALKRFDSSRQTFDQLVRVAYSLFIFLLNTQS